MIQDIGTDTCEILVDVGIGIPENCQALFTQILIPCGIGLFTGAVVMLGAVQLDNQLLLSDVEINDVSANDLLAMYRDGKCFQKIIPKVPLVPGHIFPEFFGENSQIFV